MAGKKLRKVSWHALLYLISTAQHIIQKSRINPPKNNKLSARGRKFPRAKIICAPVTPVMRLLSTAFERSSLVCRFIPPATSPFTTNARGSETSGGHEEKQRRREEDDARRESNSWLRGVINFLSLRRVSSRVHCWPIEINDVARTNIRRRCNEAPRFLVLRLNEHGKRQECGRSSRPRDPMRCGTVRLPSFADYPLKPAAR